MSKKGELVGIDRVIRDFKDEKNLNYKDREFAALRQWKDIVGDRLAAQTEPLCIIDKSLYVKAKASVWCQEISFLKSEITKKVNKIMGFDAVKEIKFRVEEGR